MAIEVLQKWVLIPLKDMPHIFENVQGLIKELFQINEQCHVIGTRGQSKREDTT